MHKLYFGFSLAAVVLLLALSWAVPGSAIMWLADVSPVFTVIRLMMVIGLVGLILTNPPRKIIFRLFLGSVGIFLVGWALSSVYSDSLRIFDFLMFLQVGIAFGISALERTPEEIVDSANELVGRPKKSARISPY